MYVYMNLYVPVLFVLQNNFFALGTGHHSLIPNPNKEQAVLRPSKPVGGTGRVEDPASQYSLSIYFGLISTLFSEP